MTSSPRIGLVGGMGPAAGLLLAGYLVRLSAAHRDQDHADFVLMSCPSEIGDRSDFLLGRSDVNPGIAIAEQLKALLSCGVTRVGIPCNTAHAPAILAPVRAVLAESSRAVEFVHLIDGAAAESRRHVRGGASVGVLCTAGLARFGVYQSAIARAGLNAVMPNPAGQDVVDDAIRAVKANEVDAAVVLVRQAVAGLAREGAELVVLGCTELPLLLPQISDLAVEMVDPLNSLAEALLSPLKLI